MSSRMIYKCADCGKTVVSNHGVLSRQEEVVRFGKKEIATITGEGLGTFTCPSHPFRYVTVMRDLSGGKEANRELRKCPVTVKRHTRVVRTARHDADL